MRIGLISDTHGLLRPQALEALAGVDRIIHAGDIGNAGVLEALAAIAPVDVVRGNNDSGAWAAAIPHSQTLAYGGVRIYLLHDINELKGRMPPVQVGAVGCRGSASGTRSCGCSGARTLRRYRGRWA